MEKYIEGFKVFKSDFTTMGGIKFSVGMHKHVDGEVKAGPVDGNGFHLCVRFEDTFRFVKKNPILCEVIGYGDISREYIDYYNDYDGIYACSDLYVKRLIPREEIISMAIELPDYRLQRLISTYKMTEEEIAEVEKSLFNDQLTKRYINYYQRGNKDAFNRY